MVKKATPSKKKVNYKEESLEILNEISREIGFAKMEFDKFSEKGTKACLGRVRKHLMYVKRSAGLARKSIQEVRNALK